jgi:hypothetical protein
MPRVGFEPTSPVFSAGENSSCLWSRSHCDRLFLALDNNTPCPQIRHSENVILYMRCGSVSMSVILHWRQSLGPQDGNECLQNFDRPSCNVKFKYNIVTCISDCRSRDNLVGITTSYGLDGRSSIHGRVKNFLHVVHTGSGDRPTHPVGMGAFSPRVKWPGREADRSPPTSAEVKKMWIYTTTSTHAFME